MLLSLTCCVDFYLPNNTLYALLLVINDHNNKQFNTIW